MTSCGSQRAQTVASRLFLRSCGSGPHGPRSGLPARGGPPVLAPQVCLWPGRLVRPSRWFCHERRRPGARSVCPVGVRGVLQHAPRDRGGSGTSPRAPERRVLLMHRVFTSGFLAQGVSGGGPGGRRWGRGVWRGCRALLSILYTQVRPLLPFVEPVRSVPASLALGCFSVVPRPTVQAKGLGGRTSPRRLDEVCLLVADGSRGVCSTVTRVWPGPGYCSGATPRIAVRAQPASATAGLSADGLRSAVCGGWAAGGWGV